MSNEELIAEARERAERPQTGAFTAQCLRELADALEAVTAPSPDHVKAVADTLMRVHAFTTVDPLELAKACTLLAAHHHEDCPATDDLKPAERQFCYVEKWVDGSGVSERITFDTEAKARKWYENMVQDLEGLNAEVDPEDRIVASIEHRTVFEPGAWEPVGGESNA